MFDCGKKCLTVETLNFDIEYIQNNISKGYIRRIGTSKKMTNCFSVHNQHNGKVTGV